MPIGGRYGCLGTDEAYRPGDRRRMRGRPRTPRRGGRDTPGARKGGATGRRRRRPCNAVAKERCQPADCAATPYPTSRAHTGALPADGEGARGATRAAGVGQVRPARSADPAAPENPVQEDAPPAPFPRPPGATPSPAPYRTHPRTVPPPARGQPARNGAEAKRAPIQVTARVPIQKFQT